MTFKNTATDEMITTDFDLLHVVPPQTAHKFVRDSPLTNVNNCVDVDHATLRHAEFQNVFALGDVANLPTAKTAAAVFSQTPVLVNNLLKSMNNESLNAHYNGYSSCPLFVGNKKLMLMEFKYGNEPHETFTNTQEKPTSFAYYLKKAFFPEAYWNFVPNGTWYGSRALLKPRF